MVSASSREEKRERRAVTGELGAGREGGRTGSLSPPEPTALLPVGRCSRPTSHSVSDCDLLCLGTNDT
ncbi:hypothetical protein EYF80_003880 [Liparis tanakae]|uniref:Uncharacterized protein n=1 Tax=Liparis tanakae TaxID=230148 RepID=A0A4Z2J768_9TELE|nr:hypothetical protein EYF80_003880 [Liparis tanakae]